MFCMWTPPSNLDQAPEPNSALWRARHWQQAGTLGWCSETKPGFEKMDLTFRKTRVSQKTKIAQEADRIRLRSAKQ